MNGPCLYICNNKTEYGYCQTTGCINPKYGRTTTTTTTNMLARGGKAIKLISKKDAVLKVDVIEKALDVWQNNDGDTSIQLLLEWLRENEPTVDYEPVKHGHWIVHKQLGYSDDYYYFECSHCHADDIYGDEYEDECDFEYCPRCGAKMDEEVKK